jgi:hypothetical protein
LAIYGRSLMPLPRRCNLRFGLLKVTASGRYTRHMLQLRSDAVPLAGFLSRGSQEVGLLVDQRLPGDVIEQTNVAAPLQHLFDGSTARLGASMNLYGNRRVDLGSRDFFQELGAFALGGEEKGVEFALREEHRAAELIKGEIGPFLDGFANLGLSRRDSASIIET